MPEEENANVKVGQSQVSPRKGKSSIKVTPFRRKPDDLWTGKYINRVIRFNLGLRAFGVLKLYSMSEVPTLSSGVIWNLHSEALAIEPTINLSGLLEDESISANLSKNEVNPRNK